MGLSLSKATEHQIEFVSKQTVRWQYISVQIQHIGTALEVDRIS